MVCVTLQNLLCPVMSSVITGKKITLLPRWTAIINTRQSSTRTHTLPHCTHNSWWLVLGWVTTKEDHPHLRIAYISYTWRVIKFINSIQFMLETFRSEKFFSGTLSRSWKLIIFSIARKCIWFQRSIKYCTERMRNHGLEWGELDSRLTMVWKVGNFQVSILSSCPNPSSPQ